VPVVDRLWIELLTVLTRVDVLLLGCFVELFCVLLNFIVFSTGTCYLSITCIDDYNIRLNVTSAVLFCSDKLAFSFFLLNLL